MRISLLLEREPFWVILEKTLQTFLPQIFQQNFSVCCQVGIKPTTDKASRVWRFNPYLNVIFPEGGDSACFEPVRREFSTAHRKWLIPLQVLYVRSASGCLSGLLSQRVLVISPQLPGLDKIIILGGNNRIRLLDFNNGKCYVIAKAGFDRCWFEVESETRKTYPWLPAPRLLVEGNGWFAEELIVGTPVNRMRRQPGTERLFRDFFEPLQRLQEVTATSISLHDYSQRLVEECAGLSGLDNVLPGFRNDSTRTVVDRLARLLHALPNVEVRLCLGHGDLQPGNMLYGNENHWLIDWEYAAVRQIGYDGLVFALKTRSHHGLGERISRAFRAPECYPLSRFLRLREMPWERSMQRRQTLALFLLEELSLKLRENSNPLFLGPGRGFEHFIDEIEKATESLEQ